MAVYGVGTRNAFELLDEDSDQPRRKAKATPAAAAAAPAAATGRGRAQQAAAAPVAPIQGQFDKPNNRSAPRTRAPRENVRDRGQRTATGGRVYERHSGTGRDRSTRKGGYGGYAAEGDWRDDLAGQTQPTNAAAAPAAAAAAAAAPAAAAAAAAAPAATGAAAAAPADAAAQQEVKKAPEFLSLAQHEEMLKKKAVAADQEKKIRKVDEDAKGLKKGVLKTKKDDDLIYELGEQKKETKKKEAKAKKAVLNVDEFFQQVGGDAQAAPAAQDASAPSNAQVAVANVASPSEGGFVEAQQGRTRGRGRGGRGAARGGARGARGGRGGARGGGRPGARLDLKDDSAFPALGK